MATSQLVPTEASCHKPESGLAAAPQRRRTMSVGYCLGDYNHATWEPALKHRWTTAQMDLTAEWRKDRKAVVKLDSEESIHKWLMPQLFNTATVVSILDRANYESMSVKEIHQHQPFKLNQFRVAKNDCFGEQSFSKSTEISLTISIIDLS